MRISEILVESTTKEELTALSQLLQSQAEDNPNQENLSVDQFIELAREMGANIDIETLQQMVQQKQIKNIENISNDEIVFKGAEVTADRMPVDKAKMTVKNMAKRALKR